MITTPESTLSDLAWRTRCRTWRTVIERVDATDDVAAPTGAIS